MYKAKAEKHYLSREGSYCPFCGDSNITTIPGEGVRIKGDMHAYNPLLCKRCGGEWNDLLTVTGIEIITDPSDAWPIVLKYQREMPDV